MTAFTSLLRNIVRYRAMILALGLRDVQARYIGTLFGWIWVFAPPITMIVIYYYVFAVGFKSKGPVGTNYILWFVGGLVPWFFFSSALTSITNSITGNLNIVKKTIFPTDVFPLVYMLSELITHGIFLLILLAMMVIFHVPFFPERLMFVYYLLCTCVLVLGLGWILSALQVFYTDIAQGLGIVLNLLFWVTPIVWSKTIMPKKHEDIITLNPLHYIIDGYRESLIFQHMKWPSIHDTLYFWGVTLIIFFAGHYVFSRLKNDFADIS